jgi:hypothetical protein
LVDLKMVRSSRRGSQACVDRECPVEREFDYEHRQCIVTHGTDRFAGDLTRLEEVMREYDAWVDFLHVRDDALDSSKCR